MTIASEHKVPVVLVEKPIAVQGEDWKQLCELEKTTEPRFIVNKQLHFHPPNLALKRDVANGRIGEIRFVDASARLTILGQGVHLLELAHSYTGYAKPIRVFAQVSGAKNIPTDHPSPDTSEAAIEFERSIRGQMATGYFAPKTNPEEEISHHKRIAVYGTEGFVHWTMVGWEKFTKNGGYESGENDYFEQDDYCQAGSTDSEFELLDDPSIERPTRLQLSLTHFFSDFEGKIGVIFIDGKIVSPGERERLSPGPRGVRTYVDHFLQGGYPEPVFHEDPSFHSIWMEQYHRRYIERDICRLFARLDIIRYRRFTGMLSSSNGTVINRSELGRSLDISGTSG